LTCIPFTDGVRNLLKSALKRLSKHKRERVKVEGGGEGEKGKKRGEYSIYGWGP